MNHTNKDILVLFFCSCSLLLSACSHTPEQSNTPPSAKITPKQSVDVEQLKQGQQIAKFAQLQLGKPYRYGGASPKGFDCSGLVYYSHTKLGIRIPRTSSQQYNFAKPVKLNKLAPGDAVFFTLSSKKISHVGIYVGKGQFIHAPKSGKQVSRNNLSDPFWKPRIAGAGRLY